MQSTIVSLTAKDGRNEAAQLAALRSFFGSIDNMRASLNLDVEPRIAHAVDHSTTPLDHHDRVGEVDVEIVERHHRLKKDSPSGTAVTLASDIRAARGLPPEAVCHGREGLVGPRPAGELGVHAVRGGTWVGDHQILLDRKSVV